MENKIIKKANLEDAFLEIRVLNNKLKDIYKQTPIFWYSLNLECNDKEEVTIFLNTGSLTKFTTHGI